MLQNEYLVAKIGFDTAENEPTFARAGLVSRRLFASPDLVAKTGVDTAENESPKVLRLLFLVLFFNRILISQCSEEGRRL